MQFVPPEVRWSVRSTIIPYVETFTPRDRAQVLVGSAIAPFSPRVFFFQGGSTEDCDRMKFDEF